MELRKSRRKKYCNVRMQPPFPIFMESELGISLDHWVPIICTGKFNGLGVTVKDVDEINILHGMGFFGKGSLSRSTPKLLRATSNIPQFIRFRQYLRRKQWHAKYRPENCLEGNIFELQSQISKLSRNVSEKDDPVIEVLSSDDEIGICDGSENQLTTQQDNVTERNDDDDLNFPQDSVIVLQDSDDENEDYFKDLNPKLHIEKSGLKECLVLTLQESFFLTYALGCLQIVDYSGNQLSIEESWRYFCNFSEDFAVQYVAYHYFRSKGYVVKPGIKFGGDYLLYKDGPPFYHADYVVIVESIKCDDLTFDSDCNPVSTYDWCSLHGIMRMANTAVKEILIAQVIMPESLTMEEIRLNPEHIDKFTMNELLVRRSLQEKERQE